MLHRCKTAHAAAPPRRSAAPLVTTHQSRQRWLPATAAAAGASPPPTQPPPQPQQPPPASAADYLRRWEAQERPRIEALWAATARHATAAKARPARFLLALDAALAELRSSRALALHLAQQHGSADWAAAATQVAAECRRFDEHFCGNRRLAARLRSLQQQLSSSSSNTEQQQQQQPGAAPASELLTREQQAQLCSVLLQSLAAASTPDGEQWMAALEAPDANQQRLRQLQAKEADLVAAIDAVVAAAVPVLLPAPPDALLDSSGAHSGCDESGGEEDEPPSSSSQPDSLSSSSTSAAEAAPQQPVLVAVTRGMLARLLQQAPDASVRQTVSQQALQPKLLQASSLLAQLASCRQQQALLAGHPSYLAAMQEHQRLPPGPLNSQPACMQPAAYAVQLAEQLEQLQHKAVQHVLLGNNCGASGASTQQQQQQQLVMSPAWDWDYLLHVRALQPLTTALRAHAAELQQHLHLHAVLAGMSGLLQQLLGVQLVPCAAPPLQLWAPHVVALDVMAVEQQQQQQQQRQLGTIFVDVGGGYGARMLRYACAHGAGSEQRSTPAVAVGIAGARLAAPGLSQQQPEEELRPGNGAAEAAPAAVPDVTQLLLSTHQLWELGHELGHAVHLVLSSSGQPACHLSGRFLPAALLELPPQVMERLLLCPDVLSRVCLHHASGAQLPAHIAALLADMFGAKFNSAPALGARVSASLAELMLAQYGGGSGAEYEDLWRGAWEAASGLPPAAAAAGSVRELALLPVVAAHQGTYHCYLAAWSMAAQLWAVALAPLLLGVEEPASPLLQPPPPAGEEESTAMSLEAARHLVRQVMSVDAASAAEVLYALQDAPLDAQQRVWRGWSAVVKHV